MGPVGWEVKAMLSCGPVCSPAPIGANRTLALESPCGGAVSFVQSALCFLTPAWASLPLGRAKPHRLLLHQAFSPTWQELPCLDGL